MMRILKNAILIVMRFYAVPDAALNTYHVDRILFFRSRQTIT